MRDVQLAATPWKARNCPAWPACWTLNLPSGSSGVPAEAQRSGFGGERRYSTENELLPKAEARDPALVPTTCPALPAGRLISVPLVRQTGEAFDGRKGGAAAGLLACASADRKSNVFSAKSRGEAEPLPVFPHFASCNKNRILSPLPYFLERWHILFVRSVFFI